MSDRDKSPASLPCDREGCENPATGYDAWGQWCEEHSGGSSLHVIPIPQGWSVEQAWEAIARGDREYNAALVVYVADDRLPLFKCRPQHLRWRTR